jgi:hypothetical protein
MAKRRSHHLPTNLSIVLKGNPSITPKSSKAMRRGKKVLLRSLITRGKLLPAMLFLCLDGYEPILTPIGDKEPVRAGIPLPVQQRLLRWIAVDEW